MRSFAFVLVSSMALTTAASAQTDARWGVLKDLVGGDYQGRGNFIAVRQVDSATIVISLHGKLASNQYRFILNESTGALTVQVPSIWGASNDPAYIGEDGTVHLGKPRSDGKAFRLLSRENAGADYRLQISPGTYVRLGQLEQGGEFAARRDRLVAAGKLTAAANVAAVILPPQVNSTPSTSLSSAPATPPPPMKAAPTAPVSAAAQPIVQVSAPSEPGAQASANARSAGAVTLPANFRIVWMRGLIVADDPQGAVVIKGNDEVEIGTVYTKVNDAPVTSASDLIAKIEAADLKALAITSSRVTQSAVPFYVDAWAENLRYFDTPGGVYIQSSAYPDEAGKYLEAINGEKLRTAADVRRVLLALVQDTSTYRSRTTRELNASEAAFVEAARKGSAASIPPEVRERWGALAALPGKAWYCTGLEPGQWLQRRPAIGPGSRTLAVARMTSAKWIGEYSAMEVLTQQGSEKWVDRIDLRTDGTFVMTTSGLRAFNSLKGFKASSDLVVFPIESYKEKKAGMTYTYLTFYANGDYPGSRLVLAFSPGDYTGFGPMCQMEEYDDVKAPRFSRELEYTRQEGQKWIETDKLVAEQAAQRRTEGEQMLAGMRASAMAEIARIPQVVADVSQQKAELERLRVAAQQETEPRHAVEERKASGGGSATGALPPPGAQQGAGGAAPTIAQSSTPRAGTNPARPSPAVTTPTKAAETKRIEAAIWCYYHARSGANGVITYMSQLGTVSADGVTTMYDVVRKQMTDQWRTYLASQNIQVVDSQAGWVGDSACHIRPVAEGHSNRNRALADHGGDVSVREMPWTPSN